VHRIGRTGRAGKEGTAWTFVTPREIDHLHFIEKVTRHRIARKPLPSVAEAMEGKQRVTAERILHVMQEESQNEFKGVAIQLLEQYDSVNLLAAAIKLLTGEKRDVEIELTPEDPIRAKKRRPDVRSQGRRMGSSFGGDRRGGGYRGGGNGGSYGRKDGGRSSTYRGSGGDRRDRDYAPRGRSSWSDSDDNRQD